MSVWAGFLFVIGLAVLGVTEAHAEKSPVSSADSA